MLPAAMAIATAGAAPALASSGEPVGGISALTDAPGPGSRLGDAGQRVRL